MRYDVVVAGRGAMGSAAVHQLANAGANVLGLEISREVEAQTGDQLMTQCGVGSWGRARARRRHQAR